MIGLLASFAVGAPVAGQYIYFDLLPHHTYVR